jgi:hypothetical protein
VNEMMRTLFWTCAVAFALAIAAGGFWSIHNGYGDWHPMLAAWQRIGTRALTDPLERWQIFVYLPATAYLFAPFESLSMNVGFVANAVVMMLCAVLAGLLAARVYGLTTRMAIGLFVTWPPAVYAAAILGQNASFGLLLSMLAIAGTAAQSPLLTALPIGLLLYKPTYALPLIGVLVVRKRWRECGIVALCAAAWYLFSVRASGNDWQWPAALWRVILSYAPGDLAFSGPLAISATSTLLRLGVSTTIVALCLVAVAALGYLAVARAKPVEAMTGATLLALAWSPHAWAYDAALALPMIAFVLAKLAPFARTCALFVLYGIAAGFFFSRVLGFDLLLFITVGGSSAWILAALWGRRLWLPSVATGERG